MEIAAGFAIEATATGSACMICSRQTTPAEV